MSDAVKKTAAKKTEATKAAPKETPKEAHKEAPKAAAKEAPKVAAKEAHKEAPKEAAKEVAKDAPKEAAKKEAPKKAAAEPSKDETAGKGVKGKGTSTKGPTKSAPGSKEAPKAKPDSQPASAFSKPLTPSKELAAVLGSDEALPRTAVVSKVWEYIKKHKLQNESNKREILADAKLKPIFEADMRTMFEMNKYINNHLKG